MLTINSFAPFLYALIGAVTGGLVFFGCFQLWRWVRRRYPTWNLSFLNIRLLDSAPRHPASTDLLTFRELEIALLAAQGKRTTEIAHQLSISRLTVETHIKNIYKKLDIRSRVQLARLLEALGYPVRPRPP